MEYKQIRIHFTSRDILSIRIQVGESLELNGLQIISDYPVDKKESRQLIINWNLVEFVEL